MHDPFPDTFAPTIDQFFLRNNFHASPELRDAFIKTMHAIYDTDIGEGVVYDPPRVQAMILEFSKRKPEHWIQALLDAFLVLLKAIPQLPPGPFAFTFQPSDDLLRQFMHPILSTDDIYHFFSIKPAWDDKRPPKPEHIVRSKRQFRHLFPLHQNFSIPQDIQFAHTWVVAGSGHGKTTLLTSMLMEHVSRVLKGEASIVLLDSQNVIIPALERLKVWKDTNRLIVIDPADPIAFSLFDVPDPTPGNIAAAIELVRFIFAKLTDSELTYRQANLFDYATEFLITAYPGATIHDFRNLLNPQRAKQYEPYFEHASSEVRDYFETDFVKEKFTVEARAQVVSKMRAMLRMPAFVQMFGAPKTKLNLFKELERGTCIVIRPSKALMGDAGTMLFGRFWIAQMKMVAQQRQFTQKKTPTFFFIDEAQDYLGGGEPQLQGILEQARKENIGVSVFNHNSDQFKSHELVNILGSVTATKIIGSPGTNDLSNFATYLQCHPSFIMQQEPKKTFAAFIRGATKQAISMSFPFIDLSRQPQMSEAEWKAVRARNRERYGADATPAQASAPPRVKTVGHTATVTFLEFNVSLPCILDTGADSTYVPCTYSVDGNTVTLTLGGQTHQRPLLKWVNSVGFDGSRERGPVIHLVLMIEGHAAREEVTLGANGNEILIGRTFMAGRFNISSGAAHENVKPQPTDKRPNPGKPSVNTDLDPDL
jgi:hypothetical protein